MVLLRYLLMMIGIGLLVGAAGILVWDLYQVLKSRKSPPAESESPWGESMGRETLGPQPAIRWHVARKLAALAVAPLLIGWSFAVVSTGTAAVRVNQFAGTRPGTL